MDTGIRPHQTINLSVNTLHDNISTSSIEDTTIEQAGTGSRDPILGTSPSRPPSDEINTQTEPASTTELLSLKRLQKSKRSNSIASSLQVRDGYDTGLWHNFSYWATEMWFYDFCAWLISCYCFAGIVITLMVHRDQPIPEWPFNITINALVSALSTVMGSALLVPVSNAIGQSKWSWIQKDRRKLEDIAIYDDASRGPWGSLVFLQRKGFRGPVAFGALITIFTLPIAPLVQQTTAVVLEKRPVENAFATLHGLNWWAEGLRTEYGIPRIKDNMVMAINRGLFFDGNFSDPFSLNALRPRPQCQTGNCSFDVFESLAICSECRDIGQFIRVQMSSDGQECGTPNNKDCARITLPNGHNSGWMNSTSGVLLNTSTSRHPILLETGLSILNLTAIAPCWRSGDTDTDRNHPHQTCGGSDGWKTAQAQECSLRWCINKYKSEMTNGVLQEKVISSIDRGDYAPGFMYDFSPQNKSVSYQVILNSAPIEPESVPGYQNITTGLYSGRFSDTQRHMTQMPKEIILKCPTYGDFTRQILGGFKNGSRTRYFDMSPTFEAMALSMTSALRTPGQERAMVANYTVSPDGYRPSDDSWDFPTQWQPNDTAPTRLLAVLRVRWAWITLPATLELFMFLLLCYVASWKSQGSLPVWKSSTLPLLLFGSEMHDAHGEDIPRHIMDMEKLAKQVSIKSDIAKLRSKRRTKRGLEDGRASDETRGHESKEEFSIYS
ncbi:uncharacterized protein PG998_006716 [Apiospora kogelbergensis]|uniref:uncharacterized protein n=1 Tax=Apiospora kogelbergensis TaxID=1337665 RepID=UPI003130BA57